MDFNNQENNQNVMVQPEAVQPENVQSETVQAENVAPVNNEVPPVGNPVPPMGNPVPPAYNAVPPTYVPEQPANPNNGFAIGALVCGIVGILLCCCCGIGIVVGIAGIIFAILSKKYNGGKISGMALAGLICSAVAIVFGAGYLIYSAVVGVDVMTELENLGYYYY